MLARLRDKHFDRWLPGYLKHLAKAPFSGAGSSGTRHVLFAFCDHYEPLWAGSTGKADTATGQRRVDQWHELYPKLANEYVDADGRHPQHSFFFPGEEYHPGFFDKLDDLVRRGYGEVELHLHHHADTEATLEAKIREALTTYAERGHFARGADGSPRYAFIHGNWALANGRPDGKQCGVDAELPLLFRTGCYTDMTFPSCPDVTQPGLVNEIYWPIGDLNRKRAYEYGISAQVGHSLKDRLLMITGPLGFAYNPKKKRPRLEYGAVTAEDPGSVSRVKSWVNANIHVAGRPEWIFVKVYTHGAPDRQAESLLGAGGHALHKALAEFNDGKRFRLHYVTAREMYNIAQAAMAGKSGDANDYRDFELAPPPIRAESISAAAE
ncbi:MAG: hypothetical protein H6718_18420 [Polyangiaceae bacterium]|nr:hypothetical protein [Polyangiaceae bacterium]MCB9605821.1 hypothetical protein [Polyangiaceae bacterium]